MKTISDPKVSVIIPVYQPGETIKKCLKSLQNQTISEIELIFVDDCGNDGSLQFIRDEAEKDLRIQIIKNEKNYGPGVSRNKGIEAARGQYLTFVDADDFVSKDYLELLYNKAISTSKKIVRGTFAITEGRDNTIDNRRGLAMLNRIREGLAENKPLYSIFLTPFVCALYLRSWIIECNIRFGTMNYSEDKIFLLHACHSAGTMAIEERAVYYYLQKPESLVHTLSELRLRDSLAANEAQLNYILTKIKKEEISVDYLLHLVEYPLVIQAAAARQDRLKSAAEEFLQGLAEESRSFPDQENVKKRSATVAALIEYGVNISTGVYWEESAEEESAPYLDAVSRLLLFADKYPERIDLYRPLAKQAVRNAVDYRVSRSREESKKRKCSQNSLTELLIHGNSDNRTHRIIKWRFLLYYFDALVHSHGHRVKERIRLTRQ